MGEFIIVLGPFSWRLINGVQLENFPLKRSRSLTSFESSSKALLLSIISTFRQPVHVRKATHISDFEPTAIKNVVLCDALLVTINEDLSTWT